MELNDKISKLKDINNEISHLYRQKSLLERQILDDVDTHIIQYKNTLDENVIENIEIDIENILTIGVLYKKKLNHNLLKQKHPDVYMWGRKIIFDYETALLSFRDKKKFWKVISECTEVVEKVSVKPKTNQKAGKKYGRKT
jgi:hypothetical protein